MIGFMENNKDDDDDYVELNVILVWVARFFHIWEVPQISGRKLAVLTEGFCGFPLCVQQMRIVMRVLQWCS